MIVLIALLTSLLSLPMATEKGHLQIEITGLKKPTGKVYLAVFDQSQGYPIDTEKATKRMVIPVKGLGIRVPIQDLELGRTYAITFYHDANDNGKMDTNFFGIPQELYGASNNARGHLGPPKFSDAQFVFQTNGQWVKMKAS